MGTTTKVPNGETKQLEIEALVQRLKAKADADAPRAAPRAHGKTKTTQEAMVLLAKTRDEQIRRARDEAVLLCKRDGSTHSRAVRARMASLGLLNDAESEFWLGAVFRDDRFVPTGTQHTYSDRARNVHERTVKVWRLR